MEKTTHLKFSILAILFFVGLAASPAITHAATLYFSPSSGSHAVGTTLSVSIYVSSADQAMNAASSVISFPRDKLEVTSLSKTGSIFSLWVQEPSFSNSGGTINFEGIVLNPGFTGRGGKVITLTFRTKVAGSAPLTFSSGSVLANDGKGTNILTGMGSANFVIDAAVPRAPETITPPGAAGTPKAPDIKSLEAPIITEWPRELQSGEQLIIKGTSKYPNAQIVVWLQQEGKDAKSQSARSDDKGNFVFVADEKLSDGVYKLWAEAVDERGAQSKLSDTVTIAVGRPVFLKLGSGAVGLPAAVVPLVALIFILLFIILYGWHKFASFRKELKNLRKEVRKAESALRKAFNMLKEDIHKQVKLLKKTRTKKQLTEEKKKIIKQLSKRR